MMKQEQTCFVMIFDGAGVGSTQHGSRIPKQVSVLKSVAFWVFFCAVRAFFRTNMFGHDFSTGRVGAQLGLAQGFGNRFRF